MENHIVVIASEFKGNEVLEEAKKAGWHVSLVTREDFKDSKWIWENIDDFVTVPKTATSEAYIRAATNFAGRHLVHRVIGVDEFDVLTAARAREHLQIKGMSNSHALRFRDKLRMRIVADEAGLPCPDFVGCFNPEEINAYLERVEFPVIVKPRTEVSAFGIRKCENAVQVWDTLNGLDARNTWRDHPSQYQIEKFIEGNVYHVDSVIHNGKVVAAGVSKYGTTPLNVSHKGGVFTSSIVDYKSKERRELEGLNRKLLKAFDHKHGVSHAEFLESAADGKFYLLEVACRVGGAYIANVLEEACGFNIWREWGKLTIETEEKPYTPPKTRKEYAGITLALANQECPDTSHYTAEEITYRVNKPKHCGLIFRSKSKERVQELMDEYSQRITEDFLQIVPTKERHDDHYQ
jgi:biotin carboxylase